MLGDGRALDASRPNMSTEGFVEGLLTDETPSAFLLLSAPLVDLYKFELIDGQPFCTGMLTGHPVLPDGRVLIAPQAVGRDKSWLRATDGMVWRLGKSRWPPILEVVTAKDWHGGLLNLLDMRGWQKQIRSLALQLDCAAKDPWPNRRLMAREIRGRLHAAGQSDMDAAFAVLSADVGNATHCLEVVDLLQKAIGGGKIQTFDRIIRGWKMLADGYKATDIDPVTAPKHMASLAEAAMIGKLKRLMTPAVGGVIFREEDFADECKEVMHGVVVVPKLGGVDGSTGAVVRESFAEIVGKRVPVYPVTDIAKAKVELVREFPHAESLVNILLGDLPGRDRVRFRNTLLVGAAGCGKSRLARRLGEVFGVYVGSFDGAGAGDASFGGTGRRWSTGEPCWPLNVIRACGHANPLVLIDEIDKAGTARHNGNLYNSVLTLLENETAARFADPYVQAPVDVSNVSYLLTANDDTVLPVTLKDRLRILRMPAIKPEHVPMIASGIVAHLAQERSLDARWVAPLNGDEIEIAQRMLGDGSIRRLRAVVERLLANRETSAPRN